MKKGICLLLILSALYFRGFSQISYSVSFNPDSLNITNETLSGIVYSKINYKNIFNTNSCVGKPELPCVTKRFIIPANMDVDQINIVSPSFQEVSLTHKILPKQSAIPTSINYMPTNVFSFDSVVYFSNNPFPSNIVSKTNTGYFDGGNKIVTVTIYPVQYIPASNKIKFYTNLNFNLILKPSNTNNVVHKGDRKDNKSLYLKILKAIVDNPQDISAYSDTVVDNTTKTVNTSLPFYEYVIITDNSLKSSFDNFVNFKRQKGLNVGVVTTQEIYNDPTITGDRVIPGGNGIFDNAGKIRQYLFEAYQSGITTWVLLGGDATYVPIRIGNGSTNSIDHGDNIPTDLYFADFNGNWNVDGDLFYGEETQDSPDYETEVFVGRILCSTAQQITNWTNNVINYEQNPGNGNYSYLLRSLMIQADQLQQNNDASNVSSHLLMFTPTTLSEYPSADAEYDHSTGNIINYTPNPLLNGQPGHTKGAEVVAEMNTHYGFYGWFCHGGTGIGSNGVGESGIATMSTGINGYACKLQAQDAHDYVNNILESNNGLDNTNNQSYPSVLYSTSCDVTPYDMTSSMNLNGAMNCGEAFTTLLNAGGAAFLGNTRYGWIGYSTELFNLFADLISSTDYYSHLGIAESVSKSNYNDFFKHYLSYTHNLIGCPETEIWTATPSNFQVAYNPQYILTNTQNNFSISIDNLTNGKEALVCLFKDGQILAKTTATPITNNHVDVSFSGISASTTGNIILTITAHNYIPYKANIPVSDCGYSSTPTTITANTTWNDVKVINNQLIVNPNVTLTITGKIYANNGANIIVEQGAKLIIDGGKITSACSGSMWKGIEVWGTENKSQISPDNVYQGQLEIINGGTIENAEVAVYVGKRDAQGMQVYNTGGGLIKATNAVFKNNKTGVVMMPFHNFLPSNPTTQKPNFSFFTNCTFETNSSWNIPNTYPDAFVKLYEVDGVCFNGCSFANTAPANFAVYNRGKGIVTEDGFFYLKQYCANNMNPCTNLISTTFTNLYYAVDAKKINFDNTLSITKSVFNSNYRSIYISGILTPTITDNTISIPDFDPNITTVLPTDNNPYGLYLNASTGYKVEDNTFNSATANKSTKYGAIINGSGAANNRIYRNIFTNLYIGSAAQGQNRGSGTGLVFKCNEYTNCSRDINLAYVNRFVGSASMYQGSLTEPAANLFTHAGTAQSDIYNGSFTVNYYHSAFTAPIPRWVPKDYLTSVTLFNTGIAYNKATQCPVTGGSGGSGGSSKNLANSYETIQSLTSEIAVIENQLNTLVDGGNTTLLVNEVTYSPTWEALDLRNNLLNKSPFLSDTVLASTVENESAMPPLMLTQVLTANPHAIKSENVKEKIENRQNAIPGYLMNEIENSGKSMSAKEHLESKALMLRNKRASEIYSLIIEYKQDTINKYALDSICSLLNFESTSITLLDQYAIMLQANRMNEANNYLTLINTQNDADLSYLATLVFDFKMNVKNADSLSVSDINQLTLIANSETSNCNNIARNILLKTNKISYTEPICDIIQSEAKSRLDKTPKVEKQENLLFRIYPNPAKEWVIVYYKTEASPSTLEVCDLLGKVIYTKIIDQTEGELLIETSSFPSGNYFVKLQTNGAVLKTEKMTISNK